MQSDNTFTSVDNGLQTVSTNDLKCLHIHAFTFLYSNWITQNENNIKIYI